MSRDEGGRDLGAGVSARLIVVLVVGQLGVHASMAGLRMAAPLQALEDGASTGTVGLVVALFAVAPVLLALQAGRMADRFGFHRPMTVAVALAMAGATLAVLSTVTSGGWHTAALGMGAILSGAGANFGVLAIQRSAGLAARDAAERVRLFSWLGAAPSLANVLGPVAVGVVIDGAGFAAAYGVVLLLPLMTLWALRQVPRTFSTVSAGTDGPSEGAAPRAIWDLLKVPGLKRLLLVNWLLAMCWDVHSFAVPVLGHGLGFSASTIGLILGTFTAFVTLVRLLMPWMAHQLRPAQVVMGSMLGTALIFAVYPLSQTPWQMAAGSACLGLALGCSQPMIMSMLHHLTPHGRHGESLALRSMAINMSSVLMPLSFGALGLVVGAGALFWLVGVAVAAGAWGARVLRSAP
jgi:MFS family permease